jgi:hypothetical protein
MALNDIALQPLSYPSCRASSSTLESDLVQYQRPTYFEGYAHCDTKQYHMEQPLVFIPYPTYQHIACVMLLGTRQGKQFISPTTRPDLTKIWAVHEVHQEWPLIWALI